MSSFNLLRPISVENQIFLNFDVFRSFHCSDSLRKGRPVAPSRPMLLERRSSTCSVGQYSTVSSEGAIGNSLLHFPGALREILRGLIGGGSSLGSPESGTRTVHIEKFETDDVRSSRRHLPQFLRRLCGRFPIQMVRFHVLSMLPSAPRSEHLSQLSSRALGKNDTKRPPGCACRGLEGPYSII